MKSLFKIILKSILIFLFFISLTPTNTAQALSCSSCSPSSCTVTLCAAAGDQPGDCTFAPSTDSSGGTCYPAPNVCDDYCGAFISTISCLSNCNGDCDLDTFVYNSCEVDPAVLPATSDADSSFLPEIPQVTEELNYQLLETSLPLIGVNPEDAEICDYLAAVYTIVIALVGVFAVLIIVLAGIELVISADSEARRSDAKERILSAFIGILMALAAWIILNSINPLILDTCFTLF